MEKNKKDAIEIVSDVISETINKIFTNPDKFLEECSEKYNSNSEFKKNLDIILKNQKECMEKMNSEN